MSARLEYGYQVAERQAIRLGLALQDAQLTTGPLASDQLVDWVRNNGPTVQGNESSTDHKWSRFRTNYNEYINVQKDSSMNMQTKTPN